MANNLGFEAIGNHGFSSKSDNRMETAQLVQSEPMKDWAKIGRNSKDHPIEQPVV